jgi:hypothetical protein
MRVSGSLGRWPVSIGARSIDGVLMRVPPGFRRWRRRNAPPRSGGGGLLGGGGPGRSGGGHGGGGHGGGGGGVSGPSYPELTPWDIIFMVVVLSPVALQIIWPVVLLLHDMLHHR